MNGLLMSTNERTAKVDALKIVLLGLQVCYLPDIVTASISKAFFMVDRRGTYLMA